MDRRDFLRLSSFALIVPLLEDCTGTSPHQFPIEVSSGRKTGHMVFNGLRNSLTLPPLKTDYVIVGAGLSGLAASATLKNKEFYLLELDDLPGGSSGAGFHNELKFATGAHYDLSYPSNFGREVLEFLDQLNIVYHDGLTNTWQFKEKEYLIDKTRESLCKTDNGFRKQVLPENAETEKFKDLLLPYSGKMVMPTRLINPELHQLNQLSFYQFLQSNLKKTSPELLTAIDYQLKDDYGAGADIVSALAGVHYYMCRPYHQQEMELFSPPQGNYYFVEKMLTQIPPENIKTGHLVYGITEEKRGFKIFVFNVKEGARQEIICNKIVYAAQKHALKHIYPKYFSQFIKTQYAPWIVVNIVTRNFHSSAYYWQNEILSKSTQPFMGFVDSKSQYISNTKHRVFTAYFCYPLQAREDLVKIEEEPRPFVNEVVKRISEFLGEEIGDKTVKAYINIMGHAMPIPAVGYLFPENLHSLSKHGIAFAGVDTGRLPLLFEALDSGLMTVNPTSS